MLLLEAPVLLPPNNPLVEHHAYFDKWKALHLDAFTDGEGRDAADEVVHKVASRCKIFFTRINGLLRSKVIVAGNVG
jgi:hypothetical protein